MQLTSLRTIQIGLGLLFKLLFAHGERNEKKTTMV